MNTQSYRIRKLERIRKERNVRIKWLLQDLVGALAVFGTPIAVLYIAYGFGF